MKSKLKLFIIAIAVLNILALTACDDIDEGTPSVPVITITTQPAAATTVTEGRISGSLSVTASATYDAQLTYQWYSNSVNNNTGGTAAATGGTNASFTIPTTLTKGTYYYFVEVRATDGATPLRSNVAVVTVNEESEVDNENFYSFKFGPNTVGTGNTEVNWTSSNQLGADGYTVKGLTMTFPQLPEFRWSPQQSAGAYTGRIESTGTVARSPLATITNVPGPFKVTLVIAGTNGSSKDVSIFTDNSRAASTGNFFTDNEPVILTYEYQWSSTVNLSIRGEHADFAIYQVDILHIPVLTGTVTIDNTTTLVGNTLTATYSDGNGSGEATWEWLRGGGYIIPGANSNTYTVTADDMNNDLYSRVSFANQYGFVNSSNSCRVRASVIDIEEHPNNRFLTAGRISGSLNVTASVTPGATMSYQWYSNNTNSNSGGTEITDETNASYLIPTTLAAGTYYYFAEVTATHEAAPRRTNPVTVIVTPAYENVVNFTFGPDTVGTGGEELNWTSANQLGAGGYTVDGLTMTFAQVTQFRWAPQQTKDPYIGRIAANGEAARNPLAAIAEVQGPFMVTLVTAGNNTNSRIVHININDQSVANTQFSTSNVPVLLSYNYTGTDTVKLSFSSEYENFYIYQVQVLNNHGRPALTGNVTIDNTSPVTGNTLTATYSGGNGSGTAYWEWLRNGNVITGANNNTYTVVNADLGSQLSARVSYSDQNGFVTSGMTSTVQVPSVITIGSHPGNRFLTEGRISGSLSVTASATQSATLSYQWYSNNTNSNTGGTAITDGTSASYTIPTTLAAGTYYYFAEVMATLGAAPVRCNPVTVIVTPAYDNVVTFTFGPDTVGTGNGQVEWTSANQLGAGGYTVGGLTMTFPQVTQFRWAPQQTKDPYIGRIAANGAAARNPLATIAEVQGPFLITFVTAGSNANNRIVHLNVNDVSVVNTGTFNSDNVPVLLSYNYTGTDKVKLSFSSELDNFFIYQVQVLSNNP